MVELMPLYVSPGDVITRMQLDSTLAGTTAVVSSAIQAACLKVGTLIGGSMIMQSQDCMFYLDPDAFSHIQPGGVFRLEIPSGFIRTDSTLTITYDTMWTMPNAQPIDMTMVKVDYNRGYILVDACEYECMYVRVQCTTGFQSSAPTPPFTGTPTAYSNTTAYVPGVAVTSGGNTYLCAANTTGNAPPNPTYWTPVTFAPEQIPDELYEAILSLVPSVFDSSQVTNRNEEAQSQYRKGGEFALSLLVNYVRLKGFSLRPILV